MSAATPPDQPEQLAAGHVVIGGRYVLGDILGTGGTYTVYEASRLAPDADAPDVDAADPDAAAGDEPTPADGGAADEAPLLVKVLHPHLVDDSMARAALAREIAASEQVDHPGVVKVLDSGEDEVAGATVPWILTRRLPGPLLSDLAAGTGLAWPTALAVVAGLLDALAAVHTAGLVHRDVGPRNVVVDQHDDGTMTVGLLDLGLTAPGGGDGDGELVTGSAAYMSPEQAQGRPLDARSDLYSAGALAYFALTGHAPYERATPSDVLRAHVEAPVPAPSARRAAVPTSVDRFVARAMAKNPARRFATAGAMLSSLTPLLGVGAASATTLTPDVPEPTLPGEPTQTLDQIAENDPHRTAALGMAAAAAAAGAVAAAAATGDQAELQRTRQLGAVPAEGAAAATAPLDSPVSDEAAATAVGATAVGATVAGAAAGATLPDGADGADGTPGRGRLSRRSRILLVVLAVLVAAAATAAVFWPRQDVDDTPPVPPATHSPSPTPSRSTSPTPTVAPVEPTTPTTRPTETATPSPSPTPSETPSPTASPTPSPTPTETSEPTSTPTPTRTAEPEPTPTDTETAEPEPTPTDTETTEPQPSPSSGDASGEDPGTTP
ncbi:serine/threonine-protein kinase [Isoptericola jiangsuensis]|uniref:Serine/threonine-protein kinase n=1 Tax=Isoptericola jiangsuensis TaxID=548579 RepID=A0A2A9EYC0_9MICO|nr:serine/threonine-protein kinase [Isoptericola jiangsuensis]PFG43556.1 serine/threonine-protein kinase [Isoptericola jiangsuensis]